MSHLITLAFKEQGYTVEFGWRPWKRGWEETLKGKYDAQSFWFTTEERRAVMYQSETMHLEQYVLFHLKKIAVPDWKQFTDLSEFRYGVTRGNDYTPPFTVAKKGQ